MRSARKNACARDGCDRIIGGPFAYCGLMCTRLDTEFARLQELYETAADVSLSCEAWLALAEVSDKWTELDAARGAVVKDSGRGLPTPAG